MKLMAQLAVKGWCYDTPAQLTTPSAAASEGSSATGDMLPFVLQYVGPAYIHLVTGGEEDPQVDTAAKHHLMAAYAQLVAMPVFADFLAGANQLAAILKQPVALHSLETAVRAAGNWEGRAMTVDVPALTAAIVNATSQHDASSSTPAAAARGGPSTSSSSSSGPELFSLLLSCLKAAVAPAVLEGGVPASMQAVSVALNVLGRCMLIGPSESNGGLSQRDKVALRWLWLGARALLACVQQAQIVQGGMHQYPQAPAILGKCLHTYMATVEWLGEGVSKLGPPAVDTESVNELKVRCSNVHQLLQHEAMPPELMGMVQQMGMAGPAPVMHMQQPLLAPLLLQVAGLGRTVCSALPLPFACNNQDCTRLAAVSEVTAVKGGLCSACKVARYCCVDCQKAHRPQHKIVCGKLKGQLGAAKACVDAA